MMAGTAIMGMTKASMSTEKARPNRNSAIWRMPPSMNDLLDEATALRGRDTGVQDHQDLGGPIQTLFQRGQHDSALRVDVEAEVLVQLFGGPVVATMSASLPRRLGVEQSALTASVFLDGARRHPLGITPTNNPVHLTGANARQRIGSDATPSGMPPLSLGRRART